VCDNPAFDNDGDGTANGADGCPTDTNKTDPGQCGCGNSDTDSDSDGVADCNDQCPDADDSLDANSNGTPDCLDAPADQTGGCCAPGVFPTVGLFTPFVLLGWKMRRRHGARISPQRGLGSGGQARGDD
jgi:hypothetical protein